MGLETVLTIFGTFFGATLAAIVTLTVTMVRIQHRDSRENRELIEASSRESRELIGKNRDLIDAASRENRELIEASSRESRELIGKNRDQIEKNHGVVIELLGENRERLARIEGRLGIGWPAPDAPESDGGGRAAA